MTLTEAMPETPEVSVGRRGSATAVLDSDDEARLLERSVDRELRHRLFTELLGRSPATDVSVAVPHGPYAYYARQARSSSYPVFCRRSSTSEGEPVGEEEILLDVEALAGSRAYCSAKIIAIASDHLSFVFAVDRSGDERWDLWHRDLSRVEVSDRLIQRGAGPTAALARDDRTLFFTLLDSTHRADRVVRRDLFESSASDTVVFEEPDPAFGLHLSKTESGAFVVLTSKSTDTSDIHYLLATEPIASFQRLHKRVRGVRFALSHQGDHFYVLSNRENPNFDLWQVQRGAPAPDRWRLALSPRRGASYERIWASARHVVLQERAGGSTGLVVFDPEARTSWTVPLPDEAGVVRPADNREHDTTSMRFGYSSLVTPYSIFELDLETRERFRLKQRLVGAGFDRRNYASERWSIEARDGCRIPISMVYRRDRRRPRGNPLLLHGYGAYGFSLEPEFDAARLSLLDRGVIYAIAHVRGGGDLGPTWHQRGRHLQKNNSIDDFIACARALVERGYAAPDQLAALGESAGGLLVAAAMQRQPTLFRAVVADCPFIDVIGALEDDSLPLTVSDWQEWGNPANPADRLYMETYAPLNHVKNRSYPAVLVLCAVEDPWTPWRQAAQWALQLRESTTSGRPVLLQIDRDAGHRGPSARQGFLREIALKYAFVLEQIGAD